MVDDDTLRRKLTGLAQAWADFDQEEKLRGALILLKEMDRHDLAEVLRVAWVERTAANVLREHGKDA